MTCEAGKQGAGDTSGGEANGQPGSAGDDNGITEQKPASTGGSAPVKDKPAE